MITGDPVHVLTLSQVEFYINDDPPSLIYGAFTKGDYRD